MIEQPANGMPSAIMAEKAVLSAFLRQPQRFIGKAAAEGVDADCFYLRRPIYDALTELFQAAPETQDFELVSLVTHLQMSGQLDRCGGPGEIADIHAYTYERFDEWSIWTSQLREAKARRLAVIAAQRLAEAETSEEAITQTRETLEALMGAIAGKSRAKSGTEAAAEFIKKWKSEFESEQSMPGMATGYEEIDEISGGIRGGQLFIVCAKTSRGKSVMMLQIAAHQLMIGKTVAIFTLEMMADEVTGRLVSVIGSVAYESIVQPKKSNKHHRAAIGRGITDITESKVWIDDTANQTMEHIDAECQRIKDVTGSLDLIVIDYLQIVKSDNRRGESREQEVARISSSAKQMAKKFKVPVITGSQLNATGETRESRSLENDADTLLFIADDGVKVGKMRNGKRDQVLKLFLHGDVQKFLNYPPSR